MNKIAVIVITCFLTVVSNSYSAPLTTIHQILGQIIIYGRALLKQNHTRFFLPKLTINYLHSILRLLES